MGQCPRGGRLFVRSFTVNRHTGPFSPFHIFTNLLVSSETICEKNSCVRTDNFLTIIWRSKNKKGICKQLVDVSFTYEQPTTPLSVSQSLCQISSISPSLFYNIFVILYFVFYCSRGFLRVYSEKSSSLRPDRPSKTLHSPTRSVLYSSPCLPPLVLQKSCLSVSKWTWRHFPHSSPLCLKCNLFPQLQTRKFERY